MKNIPNTIYLQVADGNGMVNDFEKHTCVTWAKTKIRDTDIQYTLSQAQSIPPSKEGAKGVCFNPATFGYTSIKITDGVFEHFERIDIETYKNDIVLNPMPLSLMHHLVDDIWMIEVDPAIADAKYQGTPKQIMFIGKIKDDGFAKALFLALGVNPTHFFNLGGE